MYLATVLDCCTKKAVGYAIGATARGIGSGVRGDQHGGPQVPVHDRGRRSSYPGAAAPRYTFAQFADHPEGRGTRPPVGRTGMR